MPCCCSASICSGSASARGSPGMLSDALVALGWRGRVALRTGHRARCPRRMRPCCFLYAARFFTPRDRYTKHHGVAAMREFKGRTAVITGAGSGIGAALARRAAAEGMNVVLADIQDADAEAVAAEIGARTDAGRALRRFRRSQHRRRWPMRPMPASARRSAVQQRRGSCPAGGIAGSGNIRRETGSGRSGSIYTVSSTACAPSCRE